MGACVQGRARGARHMRVRGACPRACLQAWMCTGTCMRVCARVFECDCTRLGVCVCACVFERVRVHTRVHVRCARVRRSPLCTCCLRSASWSRVP